MEDKISTAIRLGGIRFRNSAKDYGLDIGIINNEMVWMEKKWINGKFFGVINCYTLDGNKKIVYYL